MNKNYLLIFMTLLLVGNTPIRAFDFSTLGHIQEKALNSSLAKTGVALAATVIVLIFGSTTLYQSYLNRTNKNRFEALKSEEFIILCRELIDQLENSLKSLHSLINQLPACQYLENTEYECICLKQEIISLAKLLPMKQIKNSILEIKNEIKRRIDLDTLEISDCTLLNSWKKILSGLLDDLALAESFLKNDMQANCTLVDEDETEDFTTLPPYYTNSFQFNHPLNYSWHNNSYNNFDHLGLGNPFSGGFGNPLNAKPDTHEISTPTNTTTQPVQTDTSNVYDVLLSCYS